MKAKKIISILLFLIGFGIVLYPLLSRAYYEVYYRNEVINVNEEMMESDLVEEIYNKQSNYNQTNLSQLDEIDVVDVGFVDDDKNSDNKDMNFNEENLVGTVSVPKIDLLYPVYDGATDENLMNGVARIEGTSYPVGGVNTHSVIAGHNGLSGQIFFSRLTELVDGDIIHIQNRKEKISYEVYQTAVIEPNDVSALSVIPGQDTLTLLTCTSPPPGTHRYLVYAKRVELDETTNENAETTESYNIQTGESNFVDTIKLFLNRYALLISVSIIGLIMMYLVFFKENK